MGGDLPRGSHPPARHPWGLEMSRVLFGGPIPGWDGTLEDLQRRLPEGRSPMAKDQARWRTPPGTGRSHLVPGTLRLVSRRADRVRGFESRPSPQTPCFPRRTEGGTAVGKLIVIGVECLLLAAGWSAWQSHAVFPAVVCWGAAGTLGATIGYACIADPLSVLHLSDHRRR